MESIWACKTTHFWTRNTEMLQGEEGEDRSVVVPVTAARIQLPSGQQLDALRAGNWPNSTKARAVRGQRLSSSSLSHECNAIYSRLGSANYQSCLLSTTTTRALRRKTRNETPFRAHHLSYLHQGSSPRSRRPPRTLSAVSRIRPSAGKQRDYSPLTAQGCFSDALEVDVLLPSSASSTPTTATFRVYYTPPSPHFSSPSPASSSAPSLAPDPLSGAPATAPWLASPPKLSTRRSGGKGVVFVCVHGAGYSGLSFACFAKEVVAKGEGQVGVLAYDARGHGESL